MNRVNLSLAVRLTAYALIALSLLAFLGYLAIYHHYAMSLFDFPFDYDQGEGFELVDTILFSRGEWPYRDVDHYPFYSSNYPPLFHLILVPLVWLFGPHYWIGRVVSYLGTLATASLIGYAVHRQVGRPWLATLSGLAFLASNYVYHVGPLFRQHMFMVLLETAAVVVATVVVEGEERHGRRDDRGWLAIMLLLFAAGYTKQLAYATVAAVFIFLFLRQPRRALTWAVPFAAVTLLIFLAMNVATDGQWLLNTVTANVNPFILEQAIGLYRQWFQIHIVLALIGGVIALYQLYFERLSLYAIWFAITLVNSVSAGKWGAGESYFATTIAASCILTGLAFGRWLNWSLRKGAMGYHLSLLLVGSLFLFQASRMFHMPTDTPFLRFIAAALGRPTEVYFAPQTSCSAPREPRAIPYVDAVGHTLLGRPPTEVDTAAGREIAAWVAQGNSPAFSEEAGFNLYAGREVITNPTQLLNLYRHGAADLSEMIEMLDRRAFDTVIFRAQFYPPPVLEVIGQRYETRKLVEMNGFVYCIMVPRETES